MTQLVKLGYFLTELTGRDERDQDEVVLLRHVDQFFCAHGIPRWSLNNMPLSRKTELLEGLYLGEGKEERTNQVTATALPIGLKDCDHSSDYRFVRWPGGNFDFTEKQAACIKVLWLAAESCMPSVSQREILDAAESDCLRLRDLFKSKTGIHRAWGTLIVRGERKGTYRLSEHLS